MISELFENIKVYGRYVRSHELDGLEYWNKIKDFILRPEQKPALDSLNKILGSEWNIKIKFDLESELISNLEEIYAYVHDSLNMYGEDTDKEVRSLDRNTWSKYHFALQLIRIPKNNKLDLLRLLQVGYNLGQLSVEIGDSDFYGRFVEYFNLNKLDEIQSYIELSPEKNELIQSNIEIQDLCTNLNHFILSTMNQIQTGGAEGLEPFYSENIELLTKKNNDYRRVIYNGFNQQFVLMSIEPQDDIEMEVHKSHDQFIRIEQGNGKAIIGGKEYNLKDNTGLIVPAGTSHQIINTSSTEPLKLYSIYSPSPFEHPLNLVQQTNPNKLKKDIKEQIQPNPNTDDDIKFKNKYILYKNKYNKLKNFMNKHNNH